MATEGERIYKARLDEFKKEEAARPTSTLKYHTQYKKVTFRKGQKNSFKSPVPIRGLVATVDYSGWGDGSVRSYYVLNVFENKKGQVIGASVAPVVSYDKEKQVAHCDVSVREGCTLVQSYSNDGCWKFEGHKMEDYRLYDITWGVIRMPSEGWDK